MKKKGILLSLLIFIILVACSNDSQVVETESESKEEVSDDLLVSVVETNVAKLMEKDFEGYMATIHSDSPVFETTSETVEELFNYTLDIELSNVSIKEKSSEEAVVAYTQRTIKIEGPDFQNNETIGEHVLKLDGDTWKIYNSEVIEIIALPDEEEAGVEEPVAEEVPLEGDYANLFLDIEHPFDNEDWVLVNYDEGTGEATAEYISPEENLGNYTKIVALEFYEDGYERSGIDHFIDVFEASITELATGQLEFDRVRPTESEVSYIFTLTNDETQEDQQEIGRVFVKDDDLFVIRYTVINDTIEDTAAILGQLGEVQ